MRSILRLSLLSTLSMLSACFGGEAGPGITLRIADDLSGEIFSTSLEVSDSPGVVEASDSGILWTDRAAVTTSRGHFDALQAVDFGGIRFLVSTEPADAHALVVRIPTGRDAVWPALLTAGDVRARRRAGTVLTSGNSDREVGGRLSILLDLPGPVVSEGFRPTGVAVRSKFSGSEASMTLSLDSIREGEEPLEWHITW